jgi:hypothetical protein
MSVLRSTGLALQGPEFNLQQHQNKQKPLYPWVYILRLSQQIKRHEKIISVLNMYRLLALLLFPKQYGITTTYMLFTLY